MSCSTTPSAITFVPAGGDPGGLGWALGFLAADAGVRVPVPSSDPTAIRLARVRLAALCRLDSEVESAPDPEPEMWQFRHGESEILALPVGVLGVRDFALPSASGLGMTRHPWKLTYASAALAYVNRVFSLTYPTFASLTLAYANALNL